MRDEAPPASWRHVPLATTSLPGRKGFDDGDWIESPFITHSGIRLIQTGNIGVGAFLDKPSSRKCISPHSFKVLGCKWAHPGDILISRLADPVGRACVVPDHTGASVTAVDCTIYRPDPSKADTRYVLHHLSSRRHLQMAADAAGGSTRQRISRRNLGDLLILVPPIPEQRRIAEILDTLDEVIRHTEQVIAKLQQMKQGLLHDLLTRGIDDNGELRDAVRHPEQFKDSPLGRIPKEWEVVQLLDRVTLPKGQVDPKVEPYRSQVLVAPDHVEASTGRLLGRQTAQSQGAISGKYAFEPGAVVYSKIRPYLRKAVLADFVGLCSADMYPFHPSPEVSPRFLLALVLGQHFSRFVEAVSMRSGFPKINREELAEYRAALPTRQEQDAIGRILLGLDELQDAREAELQKLRTLKHGLMDDLLAGHVRVKVPQEAA